MPHLDKQKLITLLKEKGKNQTGAGESIGISQGAFSGRINTGFFTEEEMAKLAKYIGVKEKDLPLKETPGDKPGVDINSNELLQTLATFLERNLAFQGVLLESLAELKQTTEEEVDAAVNRKMIENRKKDPQKDKRKH